MKNNWKPKEIKVKDLEEKIRKNDIAVPTYQRGIVWTSEMQKALIDSIKRGYPFGSLVMYNYEKEGKPLLLIDGLQRSTALFKFVNNPSEYFGDLDINNDDILNVCNVIGFNEPSEVIMKAVKNKIVEWTNGLSGSDSIINMDVYKCAEFIANEIPGPNTDSNSHKYISDIKEAIDPTFKNYKDICNDIITRGIPYIEITGDDEGLSDIFFRINDRGVKLSKENKFAATWTNRSIKITNEKLKDFIKIVSNRYDQIQTDGAKIYGYDHQEFIDKMELDVFELCHAFGKYIKSRYPELFGAPQGIIKSEPIGFVILNACLLGTKEKLPDMNKLLFSKFDSDSEINTFIVKILSVIKYVDELLAPVLKFKGNRRLGGKPLHTDFQIASIVASIFKIKHIEVDDSGDYIYNLTSTAADWNTNDVILRTNIVRKYLLDSLNNIWSGHGDNTMDNIILDKNNDYYLNDIPSDILTNSLNNWYDNYKYNTKEFSEKDVSNASSQDKIILNIIYANTMTAYNQLSTDKYDIEHLYTKKLAERTLARFDGKLGLPISSIGNICLLPEYANRKKQDKIIYDDDEYTDSMGSTFTIEELEKDYTFTELDDLEWANDSNLDMDSVKENYMKFIDNRFERIKDKLITILYENN